MALPTYNASCNNTTLCAKPKKAQVFLVALGGLCQGMGPMGYMAGFIGNM